MRNSIKSNHAHTTGLLNRMLHNRRLSRRSLQIGLLIFAIIFIASIPALSSYLVSGMDIVFHLARIEGIADGLREGQFPVRMQFTQLNGYGHPVSICYGDLFLYIPALLYMIGIPLETSYQIFIILLNITTAIVSYFSFKTIFSDKKAALLGCALWTLNPYRIVDVWMRAAIGESLALVFIPLLATGIYLVFTKKETIAATSGKYGFLCLAMGGGGIVYAHILSVIMCALLVVPCVIIGLIYNHSRRSILQLLLATASWLALSTAFLIPFASYYLDGSVLVAYNTAQANSAYAARHALQPAQLFLLFTGFSATERSTALEEGAAGEMPFGIGLSFCIILIAWGLWQLRANPSSCKRSYRFLSILLVAAATCFMIMTTCIFPWQAGSSENIFAEILGKIASIQFPWRLLCLVSICLVLVGIILYRDIKSSNKQLAKVFLSVLLFCSMTEGAFSVSSYYHNWEPLTNAKEAIAQSSNKAVSTGEYLPSGVWKNETIKQSTGEIKTQGDIEVANYQRNGLSISIRIATNEESAMITLPLCMYPNYKIVKQPQGSKITLTSEEKTGFMQLNVPPGTKGEVVIEFRIRKSWTASLWLSYATFAALIVYLIISKARNRRFRKQTNST